ncbi:hypothetical protein F3I62_18815 [Pseudomonas sp. R-28-1W-6]|uniref:hypothetical protein n=1 Tax=Pseudomonas sp. R-28-1W-6 TaxID=2650101 RepID=UPI001365FD13|nr:hypothetical protein [Pseudomonas sp. R-28-1W-6]MWV14157.1 hypothetical protein [Pseudomonas sp. R-28-1W-6]
MSNENQEVSSQEYREAAAYIKKTLEFTRDLLDMSGVVEHSHVDRGRYVEIINMNILRAHSACYLSRKGVLTVMGHDPKGNVYFKGLTTKIVESVIPIKSRELLIDGILSRGEVSVVDEYLTTKGLSDGKSYVIDCQMLDADVAIKDLRLFEGSISEKGFKFGIELTNGICGELCVELDAASKYLTFDEVTGFTWSVMSEPTDDSKMGFETYYMKSRITIGDFEISLVDEDFVDLACTHSMAVTPKLKKP